MTYARKTEQRKSKKLKELNKTYLLQQESMMQVNGGISKSIVGTHASLHS